MDFFVDTSIVTTLPKLEHSESEESNIISELGGIMSIWVSGSDESHLVKYAKSHLQYAANHAHYIKLNNQQ